MLKTATISIVTKNGTSYHFSTEHAREIYQQLHGIFGYVATPPAVAGPIVAGPLQVPVPAPAKKVTDVHPFPNPSPVSTNPLGWPHRNRLGDYIKAQRAPANPAGEIPLTPYDKAVLMSFLPPKYEDFSPFVGIVSVK